MHVLSDVTLRAGDGETVVLLGTNGNGKSTLIKCVTGQVRPTEGRIVAEIDGQSHDLVGMETEDIVALGIGIVPEGRRLFPKLTVEENLLLGAYRTGAREKITREPGILLRSFPTAAGAEPPNGGQHERR